MQARARDSFFADRRAPAAALRVCRGTSCRLASATSSRCEPRGPSRPIYCAGHCDRSPVALRADGVAVALRELGPSGAPVELPSLPAIRSLGRAAIVTERVMHGEHHTLAAARAAGAWSALERALRGEPEGVLRALEASGERGRGGGAFPTGTKWRCAAQARGPERFAIANGDEGDPGSFVDRVLLEADPARGARGARAVRRSRSARGAGHRLRALRVPARRRARERRDRRSARRGTCSARGSSAATSTSTSRVALGEGSYVCGEETALLERARGAARRGAAAPAVSDRARTVRRADRGEQRRDPGERAPGSCAAGPPPTARSERARRAARRRSR